MCSALGRSLSPAGCLLCLGSELGGVSHRLLGPKDAVECGLVELVDVSWRYALAQGLDEMAGLGLRLEEGLSDSVDLGSVWIWDCAAAVWLAGPRRRQRTFVDHGSLRPMIYQKKTIKDRSKGVWTENGCKTCLRYDLRLKLTASPKTCASVFETIKHNHVNVREA